MDRIRGVVLGIAVLLACAMALPAAAQAPGFGRYAPKVQFSKMVTTSQYLPMRDGVRLAVSVTRPATADGAPAPGRFPVIWTGTLSIPAPGVAEPGQGQGMQGLRAMSMMARYGYVVVQVARRGNGPSFGPMRGYNDRTEALDAYELIDWMAAQPWSTGKVGVYGCSNTGDAAMHAVTSGNPNLKAAWAGCFSFEKYDGFLRGGIFANWGTGPQRTLEQDMANTPVQGDEAKVLLRQAAESHQGAPPLAAMWRSMPYRDSWTEATRTRFWYEGSAASYLTQMQRSGTALYIQGGWADDLRAQGLVAHANLPGSRVIIGPWGHCENGDFNLAAEAHRFFDMHLKGLNTGLANQDPIQVYTINGPAGREWKSSKVWPIPGGRQVRHYLTQGVEGQVLAPRPGGPDVNFQVRYDVDCPSRPNRGDGLLTGAPPCPLAHAGPHFASGVLTRDTEVTGDAIADLWISSTATDGNIFVYLEDVSADGKVTPVTDARLKASLRKVSAPKYRNYGLPWHRSHQEDAAPLRPGEPVQMTFAFLPTSYVFKAGHRIQVSVAGADYRERDRQTGTGPRVTIHNSAERPSFVMLPTFGG
jgi:uncharacterized protein